ncbi:GNAT family N-acetyltransferase [Gleimia sp. 6138-11-ORH1]|uniref:GNAT family N-acetyltransferase n=1 Tax=Gleimia sp. 6138-11-ORH1 TaxID=2973937 RepID=UPI0021697ECF|nr:GNAT family N-acetyltransferase [Gleimia sp. 6138-11-ORH1]MCS4484438.1 GNAT family N-acetyltransferase [Gleimia sp. 6138-11-ORH1]
MQLILDVGLDWRELTSADIVQFQALIHRIEQADGLPYRTSESEVNELFADNAQMICIGGWKDGSLKAYAFVRVRDSNLNHAMCQGGVDPNYRNQGIGGAIVSWLTQQARILLEAQRVPGEAVFVEFYVEMGNHELENHLTNSGYAWTRSFYDLRANLNQALPEVEISSLFKIVPWASQTEEAILEVENRVSYEQRQRKAQSLQNWLAGRSNFRADWSFVALDQRADRPIVAGFIMASAYEQDWEVLGWSEGSIDQIAVLEKYHGDSLAKALIYATMQAQAEAGMEHTATSLSSTNASGALGIYKTLGFETVATAKLFTLTF